MEETRITPLDYPPGLPDLPQKERSQQLLNGKTKAHRHLFKTQFAERKRTTFEQKHFSLFKKKVLIELL